jgi:hypothetical protein
MKFVASLLLSFLLAASTVRSPLYHSQAITVIARIGFASEFHLTLAPPPHLVGGRHWQIKLLAGRDMVKLRVF